MGELIFDIGMHNGDDTAYYLARGHDVVAVEANPDLCRAAAGRFSVEIASGRLTVLNLGIADEEGDLEFWVSQHSEWSSFHEEHATMNGMTATPVTVPVVRFGDLLANHGPAKFVKVDIERNDSLCIRDLQRCPEPPPWFSFEGHVGAADDIEFLAKLGYDSFRCVRQNDWHQITPRNMKWQGRARKAVSHAHNPFARKVAQRLHYRRARLPGWEFPGGCSGPLPWETTGPWLALTEILEVWQYHLQVDREMQAGGLGEWCDIHVARGASVAASNT
jgi:FkbM family methyltransferase